MLPNNLRRVVELLNDLWDGVDTLADYAIRDKLEEATKMLEDPKYLYSSWNVEDVYACAKDRFNIEISEECAIAVLDNIGRSHDATIGINWDVIEVHIENYTQEHPDGIERVY